MRSIVRARFVTWATGDVFGAARRRFVDGCRHPRRSILRNHNPIHTQPRRLSVRWRQGYADLAPHPT